MRSSAQLRRTFVAIFIGLLVATVAEAESFQETMEKAKSGDAEAQGQLGLIYQDGKGVPQDLSKLMLGSMWPVLGATWMLQSLEMNSPSA